MILTPHDSLEHSCFSSSVSPWALNPKVKSNPTTMWHALISLIYFCTNSVGRSDAKFRSNFCNEQRVDAQPLHLFNFLRQSHKVSEAAVLSDHFAGMWTEGHDRKLASLPFSQIPRFTQEFLMTKMDTVKKPMAMTCCSFMAGIAEWSRWITSILPHSQNNRFFVHAFNLSGYRA